MNGNFRATRVEGLMMVVRRNHWFAASLAIATLVAGGQSAVAQEVQRNYEEYPTVQEEFLNTFFGETGDFYRNRTFFSTLSTYFGPFPGNGIARDTENTIELYEELLSIQSTSDPTIRTVDLDNPFDTSLMLLPPYEPPVPGPRPPFTPAFQPAPPPPPGPQRPIRGLY